MGVGPRYRVLRWRLVVEMVHLDVRLLDIGRIVLVKVVDKVFGVVYLLGGAFGLAACGLVVEEQRQVVRVLEPLGETQTQRLDVVQLGVEQRHGAGTDV